MYIWYLMDQKIRQTFLLNCQSVIFMTESDFLEYAVRLFFAKQLQGYCKGALNDYLLYHCKYNNNKKSLSSTKAGPKKFFVL